MKGISDEQIADARRSAETGPFFASLLALKLLNEIERQRKAIREARRLLQYHKFFGAGTPNIVRDCVKWLEENPE